MMDIDLGPLANGPHASLIDGIARKCNADRHIQAMWVGGSLAAGLGDAYSDVDFRIAVEPGQVDHWTSPDWEQYLPIRPCGGLLLRFGEQALLHHLVDHRVQRLSHGQNAPHDAAAAPLLIDFITAGIDAVLPAAFTPSTQET